MRSSVTFTFLFLLANFVSIGQSNILDSLIHHLESAETIGSKVHQLNEIAWYYKSDDAQKAHQYVDMALELAKDSRLKKEEASAYHTKGMVYWYQGEYKEASDHYFKALKIREQIDDKVGLGRSFSNIGLLLMRQNNYDGALEYFQKSKQLRSSTKDSIGLVYSINNIAEVYRVKNEIQLARQYHQEALTMARACKHNRSIAFALLHLGDFFLEQDKLQEAKKCFKESLIFNHSLGNKEGAASDLNYLARVCLNEHHPDSTIYYASQSLLLGKKINNPKIQLEASQIQADAYALLQQYDSAYHYTRISHEIDRSISDAATEKAIIEIEAKYSTEKKKSELLTQQNQLAEQKKAVARLQRVILLLIITIILILSIYIYTRYRQQLKTNEILNQKNKEIQESNASLLQSNAALEQFAFASSHDLKEVLRNIGSYASLLKRYCYRDLNEEGKEFIHSIHSNVKQMYALLDDLLLFAQITQNKSDQQKVVDLNEVLETVEQRLTVSIQEKNAQITYPTLPAITAFPSQITQLFQNLITNGIKFNISPRPRIDISWKKEEHQVTFCVADNGIGISKDYHNKVFKVFQRLDKNRFPGTGVGLSICAKVIEHHGGKIWVESEPGKGSRFYFTLGIELLHEEALSLV